MATLKEVEISISKDISNLNKGMGRLLSQMASQTKSDTEKRIFIDGKKANGSLIGKYAESTVKKKKKEGKFTSNKVNFRDKEKLVGAYAFERSRAGYVIGFLDINREPSNGDIVEFLEERYGDVFGLTKKENDRLDEIINNFEL